MLDALLLLGHLQSLSLVGNVVDFILVQNSRLLILLLFHLVLVIDVLLVRVHAVLAPLDCVLEDGVVEGFGLLSLRDFGR
jgi:hypothetical protein